MWGRGWLDGNGDSPLAGVFSVDDGESRPVEAVGVTLILDDGGESKTEFGVCACFTSAGHTPFTRGVDGDSARSRITDSGFAGVLIGLASCFLSLTGTGGGSDDNCTARAKIRWEGIDVQVRKKR